MDLQTLSMVRSFALSARVASMPDFSAKPDGSPRTPRLAVACQIEWQFCEVFNAMFQMEHQDMHDFVPTFATMDEKDELFRLDLVYPDAKKRSVETMRPIYESMDRFIRRLEKEVICKDYLYAEDDYACGKQVHIYHRPQDMIVALHGLTHKKYRGNEECLSHLYMARHLLERFDDFVPAARMN